MGACASVNKIYDQYSAELKYIRKYRSHHHDPHEYSHTYEHFLIEYSQELSKGNFASILSRSREKFIVYFYTWLYCTSNDMRTNIDVHTHNEFGRYVQLCDTNLYSSCLDADYEHSVNTYMLQQYIKFLRACGYAYTWCYNIPHNYAVSVTRRTGVVEEFDDTMLQDGNTVVAN